ncbi:hypothetical protein [Marispirochaeta sp.]|uniref:hypothetical protein n=1 Tax=Marispirochaeta sp. TaxID=2038653 RepID=UPI0029C645CA|nr:hypothetical protein [Marispirochaeta sp.]
MLLGVLLLVSACTTSSPYNRGSLSDAMEKAKDDYPEEREVPNERDRRSRKEKDQPSQTPMDEAASIASNSGGNIFLSARGGNAFYSSPYFDSLLDAEILLSFREGRAEAGLFGGFKSVTAKSGSSIEESVDGGVIILRAGIEGRFYPFPELNFFSPYILGQAGGIYMYWSFKNPLQAGADTITSDSVGGMMLGVGAGVNVIDTDFFRVGAVCIPETHLFHSETQEGFQNDVFDYYGTVRWAVEVGFSL